MMIRDTARGEMLGRALDEARLDALIATLPGYVLMLTGYWPVVGTALALVCRGGRVAIVAPKDERELAEVGWSDELFMFRPVSPNELKPLGEAVREPLTRAARLLDIEAGRIGYERGPISMPASYAAMNVYGAGIIEILSKALPSAKFEPSDDVFRRLDAVKTPRELDRIRIACRIAERAFRSGSERLRSGMFETEAAAEFAVPLSTVGTGFEGVSRAGGQAWCMSGPNAAEAQGAFARSRPKPLARGELALVHSNAYADGYWIDVTRTYSLGEPDRRKGELFDAVLQARAAALAAIRPGARAAEVDKAARDVLEDREFGAAFKHPTGHGVGFHAIDHNARPRLHSKSDDVLEPGMIFNVEPAVYFDGECGLRHCDMVVVTGSGHEVLTPFQVNIDELIVR